MSPLHNDAATQTACHRFTRRQRTGRRATTVILLLLAAGWSPASAHAQADPLLRTCVRGDEILSLSGRWLSAGSNAPGVHPVVARAWCALLHQDSASGSAAELAQARLRAERRRLCCDATLTNVPVELRQSEKRARQNCLPSARPAWLDLVLVESRISHGAPVFRWAVDEDCDGRLDDEAWHILPADRVVPVARRHPLRLPACELGFEKSVSGRMYSAHAGRKAVDTPVTQQRSVPAPQSDAQQKLAQKQQQSSLHSNRRPQSKTLFPQVVQDDVAMQIEELRRLDDPASRKQHLQQIVDVADRILAQLTQHRNSPEIRTVLAEILYRKGRALGYMELPDVVAQHPISDPVWLQQQFEQTFQQLDALVDTTQPQFILLRIRRERRRNCRGLALCLLEKYRTTHPAPVWYFKKRYDLLNEMGAVLLLQQAASELWLKAQQPVLPVPVLLSLADNRNSNIQSATVEGTWKAEAAWHVRRVHLRPVRDANAARHWEAVIWANPNSDFRVTVTIRANGRLHRWTQQFNAGPDGNVAKLFRPAE